MEEKAFPPNTELLGIKHLKNVMIIKWTSNLSIKNKKIDDQHKGLIDAVNKLFDGFMRGESGIAIKKMINFLDKYWKEHFYDEEKLMKSLNYPGLPEQKRLHQEFIRNYNKIKKKMIAGKDPAKLAIEVEKHMGSWLINHIAKVDHKILEFVESQASLLKKYDARSRRTLKTQSAELVEGLSSIKEQMIMRMKAKKLEVALKKANISLEKSNKLKDLFMDIMRHDLLNPAGVVRMNSQLVLEKEKDVKKKGVLEAIERSSNRMIRMIENASILAKLESGEKIDFKEEDMGVLLKDSVEELSERAKQKNMKIKVNAQGKSPAVVNPLIQNVFSNFLSNAIKYGPKKSNIMVEIKQKDSKWRISVADEGEGIPNKYKKAIFERFTRLEKGAVKGSGLGLAIVKKIVEVHKGEVWVEDNPGRGSVFIVEIPIEKGGKK